MNPQQKTPGIDDIVHGELASLRAAVTAVENGVGQDDCLEGWEQAFWAASRLEDAATELAERCRYEMRKREDAEESS